MPATLSPQFIKAREDFAAWYDAKSEEIQSLIDEISDRTHHIIDEDDYDNFIEELSDYGITTVEDFEDAFSGEFEGFGEHILTEFAENYCEGTGILGDLSDIAAHCIDFNQVWYYAFQYDFTVVEFRGNSYFFHNCY